jgi:hypothetical protein
MIRGGFLSAEDRRYLIALARDGSPSSHSYFVGIGCDRPELCLAIRQSMVVTLGGSVDELLKRWVRILSAPGAKRYLWKRNDSLGVTLSESSVMISPTFFANSRVTGSRVMPSLEFQFILDRVKISFDRASISVGPADPI